VRARLTNERIKNGKKSREKRVGRGTRGPKRHEASELFSRVRGVKESQVKNLAEVSDFTGHQKKEETNEGKGGTIPYKNYAQEQASR